MEHCLRTFVLLSWILIPELRIWPWGTPFKLVVHMSDSNIDRSCKAFLLWSLFQFTFCLNQSTLFRSRKCHGAYFFRVSWTRKTPRNGLVRYAWISCLRRKMFFCILLRSKVLKMWFSNGIFFPPSNVFHFNSTCKESLISPEPLRPKVSRNFSRIQDPAITIKKVWLKPKFSQNYSNKYCDSERGNLISIFFTVLGWWKSQESSN